MYMPIKPHFCDDEAEFNPLDVKLPVDELEYVMNEMEFTYDLLEIDTDNGPRVRTSFIFHPSFIDAYWLLERKDPRMAKEYIERLMTHGTNNDNDGEKTTCKYVEIALRGKFLTIDKANRRYNGYKIIRSGKKRHIYQSQRERDDEKVSTGFFCYDDYLKAGKELLSPEQYREYLYVITELGCGRECQVDDPDIQLLLTDVLPAMGATNLRYRRSISNGRKGGRKRTFSNEELILAIKEQGLKSQKELAEYFGCSVRTIARRQADDTYQLQFENWEKWHRSE